MKKLTRNMTLAVLCCLSLAAPAAADVVYDEPLIVVGSNCIGYDCVNGEDFGDATLRLKENNLRIYFDDTSTQDGYAAQDWWMSANDMLNGGDNLFAISDEVLSLSRTEDVLLETYMESYDAGTYYIYGTYVTVDAGGSLSCTDLWMNPADCPTSVPVTIYESFPERMDLLIAPGDNSFHISQDRVDVARDGAERIVTNVAVGSDVHDVAVVSQLQTAQTTLDGVVALGDGVVDGADALAGRLDSVESGIAVLEGRSDVVEAELAAVDSALAADEEQLAALSGRIVTATADVSTLEAQTTVVETAADTNAAQLSTQAATVGVLADQVTVNRDELVILEQTITSYGATTGSAEQEVSATGTGSTALGASASARTRDTAIGYNATVTADGSVALGADSLVESQNSVAVGADSHIAPGAEGGVAIGQNAQVVTGATGAVAIGQDAVASETNTVSVGSADQQRRITYVEGGVAATDAVNFAQLQQIASRIQAELSGIQQQIHEVDERLDDSGALMTAFSALVPNVRATGDTQISLGLGHYSGANAVAGGVFHYLSDNILLSAGISSAFAGNSTAVQTGVVFGW